MVQKMEINPQQVGVLVAIVAASTPLTAHFTWMAPAAIAVAEATSFPLPKTVPQGTTVRVASANSMASVSQALKQQFEQTFQGTRVNISARGANQALQDVLANKADLAAIGRPLSDAEKAKGLVAVPVGRDKIAIVVATNNPFTKDLSIPKFAKIFRGETKNWADLGGPKQPIVFVDRINSDTRQAFPAYPAFQTGKFATGSTAVKLEDTNLNTLVQKLGKTGISFVSANQLKLQKGLRALPMDKVNPSNAKYPFSQPLFYVYKGTTPNAPVKAFLGLAGSAVGQQAIQKTGIAQAIDFNRTATAKPPATKPDTTQPNTPQKAVSTNANPGSASPNAGQGKPNQGAPAQPLDAKPPIGATGEKLEPPRADATPMAPNAGEGSVLGVKVPAWIKWLLPLGLLGLGSVLLLLPHSSSIETEIEAESEDSDASATPPTDDLSQDAWDNTSPASNDPPRFMETPREEATSPISAPEGILGSAATIAGGITAAGATGAAWSFLKDRQPQIDDDKDNPPRIDADPDGSSPEDIEAATGTATTALNRLLDERNRIVLVPQTAQEAIVRWQLTDAQRKEAHEQGGIDLFLRLYDVTGIDPDTDPLENFYQYDCSEFTQELRIEVPLSGRDYVVEVGYLDRANTWIGLARSSMVPVPAA